LLASQDLASLAEATFPIKLNPTLSVALKLRLGFHDVILEVGYDIGCHTPDLTFKYLHSPNAQCPMLKAGLGMSTI
jgi:hypothetical protein